MGDNPILFLACLPKYHLRISVGAVWALIFNYQHICQTTQLKKKFVNHDKKKKIKIINHAQPHLIVMWCTYYYLENSMLV